MAWGTITQAFQQSSAHSLDRGINPLDAYEVKTSFLDVLEPRTLLAAVQPTAQDQYMIELINRARANPGTEAARYGLADLNEGLSAGTISADAKQPLAVNPYITDAAQKFAQDLLSKGYFSHIGQDGSTPETRLAAAGYAQPSGTSVLENVGMVMTFYPDKAERLHRTLFLDYTNLYGGRGHRVNMLNPALKEVGAGFANGDWNFNGASYSDAYIATINFAAKPGASFLTGVAFTDQLTGDNFYTAGEGMSGVTVTARRYSDGKVFKTTTLNAGGYSLQLDAGAYRVYASGGSLSGTIDYGAVSIGSSNVKVDFKPSMVNSTVTPPSQDDTPPSSTPFAVLSGGVLSVNGTAGDDVLSMSVSGNILTASLVGSTPQTFNLSEISSIQISTGEGNDIITINTGVGAVYVNAGAGNDRIDGAEGNDTLTGAAGKDTIFGGAGDDRINGGLHNDSLSGDDGADRIYGNEGNDYLYGVAGVDRIWGGDGDDFIFGGSSNDKLFGEAGNDSIDGGNQNDSLEGGAGIDTLFGGAGADRALSEDEDELSGIEIVL